MRPRSDPRIVAALVGPAGLFALEALLRDRGREASSLAASDDDRSTTAAVGSASALTLVLTPVVVLMPVARLPPAAGAVGLVAECAGLALRAWSMRTLGRHYSRTLRTAAGQSTVDGGPYAVVRHPGYAGSLLVWTGFALATRSPLVVVLVAVALGGAYRRRIVAEERLLERDLQDYAAYARRTPWRVVPGVW
jgi:protein-S-isoprenylcysteine O-methyltransferase Ste14